MIRKLTTSTVTRYEVDRLVVALIDRATHPALAEYRLGTAEAVSLLTGLDRDEMLALTDAIIKGDYCSRADGTGVVVTTTVMVNAEGEEIPF